MQPDTQAVPDTGMRPSRTIRRLRGTLQDPDDVAAIEESLELARVSADAARHDTFGLLRLEVTASLAVYEATVLAPSPKVDEVETARGRLLASIGRLVVEAYSKATLERRLALLQDERTRLERALDCLVPEGRMHEVVIPRLQRRESRT